MRKLTTIGIGIVVAAVAVLAIATGAQAAHNSNNQAMLTGVGTGAGIEGKATVNYREGRGDFVGTVQASGLEAGETYSFRVNGNTMTICSFTASTGGTGGCTGMTVLGGFATAQLYDSSNTLVASGTFERHGGCRDKDQANNTSCKPVFSPNRLARFR